MACQCFIVWRLYALVSREGLGDSHNALLAKPAHTFSKMADGPNEFQLEQPPSDGISSVKFSPTSASFLVVSSWDTVSDFFYSNIY